jgi:hypothetical protein
MPIAAQMTLITDSFGEVVRGEQASVGHARNVGGSHRVEQMGQALPRLEAGRFIKGGL